MSHPDLLPDAGLGLDLLHGGGDGVYVVLGEAQVGVRVDRELGVLVPGGHEVPGHLHKDELNVLVWIGFQV